MGIVVTVPVGGHHIFMAIKFKKVLLSSTYTKYHLQLSKIYKESTHCKQVLVKTESFNIVMYDCRQKSVLCTSCRVLVVSGSQCKSHCMIPYALVDWGGGTPTFFLGKSGKIVC